MDPKFIVFSNSSTTPPKEPAIWLQGTGWVKASPASSLSVGTRLMWNYGGVDEVVRIEWSKSGKSLTIWEKDSTGKVWDNGRTMRADRLVAAEIR